MSNLCGNQKLSRETKSVNSMVTLFLLFAPTIMGTRQEKKKAKGEPMKPGWGNNKFKFDKGKAHNDHRTADAEEDFTNSIFNSMQQGGEELRDYYTKAFTEPSLDYIWCYVKVLIVLGIVLWSIRRFFSKEKPNIMLNMNDLQDGEQDLSTKVKEDRSDDDEKDVDQAGSTTAMSSKKNENYKLMTEYRSINLKRDLDFSKGPLKMTDDHKLLTKQSYAKVMAIINKHVWIKFHIS